MFLEHYNLREHPFGVTPDPRFLYLSPTHREALAAMLCGIETSRGFLGLVAPPGMGKTTLIFQLLEQLKRTSTTVFLFQTQCDSRELLRYLLGSLGVATEGQDIVSLHEKLNEILARERLANRKFVLVIDEAQNLDEAVLETVRLLSDFETASAKLVQILLVGQPQLAEKLAGSSLVQLRQRMAILGQLHPFTPAETAGYIEHRLGVAGYEGGPLFTPGALEAIAAKSGGIPRNINTLCFNALALGYGLGRTKIDSAMIAEVVADLDVRAIAQNKRPAPRLVPFLSALSPRPHQLVHARKQQPSFGRRSLGLLAVAAALVIFFGSSSSSLGTKTDEGEQQPAAVMAAPSDTPAASPVKSASSPAELPAENVGTGTTEGEPVRSEGLLVVVAPQQTLRQICQLHLGRYDPNLVEVIRGLNPALVDPNHLEAGQKILLPETRAQKR